MLGILVFEAPRNMIVLLIGRASTGENSFSTKNNFTCLSAGTEGYWIRFGALMIGGHASCSCS